jgi:hypothetical protein
MMHKPSLTWQELVTQQGQEWLRQQNMRMLNGPGLFLEPPGAQPQPQDRGSVVPLDLGDYCGQPVDFDAAPDLARELNIPLPPMPPAEPAPDIATISDIAAWFAGAARTRELRLQLLEALRRLPEAAAATAIIPAAVAQWFTDADVDLHQRALDELSSIPCSGCTAFCDGCTFHPL